MSRTQTTSGQDSTCNARKDADVADAADRARRGPAGGLEAADTRRSTEIRQIREWRTRRTSSQHERAFPRAAAAYKFAGWAAGRHCDRGLRKDYRQGDGL